MKFHCLSARFPTPAFFFPQLLSPSGVTYCTSVQEHPSAISQISPFQKSAKSLKQTLLPLNIWD